MSLTPATAHPSAEPRRKRCAVGRRLAAALALALVALGLPAAPASATNTTATTTTTTTKTTTGSCVDGGGITWHTLVVWGPTYVTATGLRKVSVDHADWSTTLGAVTTDSRVTTYDGAGRQVASLTRTATVDYRQGVVSAGRNPVNPLASGARITIRLGRDADGFGNCSVSHTPPTADPVVAAVGDMACPPGSPATATTCQQLAVSSSILAARPARLLALGDNQYGDGTLAQYRGAYAPSFGRLKAITSPVPGNHEYHTPGAAGYYDYFGTAAGERSKGYYSHDIGAWHVVMLNSERDIGATGAQLAWLKSDLAAHPNRCTLAVLHKPRFSSGGEHGSNAAMKPFVDALVAARAELMLAGHDHDYERFAPQTGAGVASSSGVTQIVSGAGGKSLYDFGYPAAHSLTRSNAGFGWLKLTLHSTSADLQFVGVGGSSYADHSTVSCR